MKARRNIGVATDGYQTLELDGRTVRSTRVQNTDPYYKQNAILRNNIDKSAVNRSWALPLGNIPFADYQNLVKVNPVLRSGDAEQRTAAWLDILKSGLGDQLRTVRRNLIPDSMRPDSGSIILPSRLQKQQAK